MEHCPPRGGLVLASNHRSMLDIPLIGAWCPRTTIFVGKSEMRRWPVLGFVIAAYGSIFVRRGESDRQAMRDVLAAIAAGQVIGMFPEGHRTRTGGLLQGQPGVAFMAQRAGVKVWPVAVTGTEQIGKRPRPRVTLRGGEPFDPLVAAQADHETATPTHQQVADTIMRRIAALLPEELRGVYRLPVSIAAALTAPGGAAG
jgi:1-acyl-sn-glycerol-3-phosphate acyltransferase